MIYLKIMKVLDDIQILDKPVIDTDELQDNLKSIIVYNDDHNSFDHVIKCFIKVLSHSVVQAEQCAHLIHFKGKASVKSGTLEMLKPFKDSLVDKGLSAVIK